MGTDRGVQRSDTDRFRTTIPAVVENGARPLWSVMIPTYNCADYLRETLAGVLAQDPGPELMQIEVVDDHSTKDDPERVVRELAGERVGFYRQPRNVGHVRNFNTALARSHGHLVHLLHGDDGVRDGFYTTMQQAFTAAPEIGAAFCRHIYIDHRGQWLQFSSLEQPASGKLSNWLERVATGLAVQAPAMVVRRSVFERLGGFDSRINCYGEDWEMWVRIALHFPVWFESEPLALYRSFRPGSLSERAARTGADTQDLRTVIAIMSEYLSSHVPEKTRGRFVSQASEACAESALSLSRALMEAGDLTSAAIQVREALRCSRSARVMVAGGLVSGHIGAKALRRKVRQSRLEIR